MSLERAATDVADLVLRDFAQSPSGGAWCLYLDIQRQNPLTGGLGINSAYQRWCEPPGEPPVPPSQNFADGGGVPCQSYRVNVTANSNPGGSSTFDVDTIGPVRLVKIEGSAESGQPFKRYDLQGGGTPGCGFQRTTVIGSDNTNVIDVGARINSITPLGTPPAEDIPVPIPPDELPPPSEEPFEVTLNVDLGGLNVNVPVVFGPVIFNTFGAYVPVSILPNADFNLNLDLSLNPTPRFGIDLDLDFVIPIGGGPRTTAPAPGAEPIPIPGRDRILEQECEEVDYDRIERIVEEAACCKPATNFQSLGTFEFVTPNQVFNIPLAGNSVIVFIAIIPGQHTKRYKNAGVDAEFGHGNASITTSGDVLNFERIYVNNHAIQVPFELADKGLRLSLKQGSIASVIVGTYVPVEVP